MPKLRKSLQPSGDAKRASSIRRRACAACLFCGVVLPHAAFSQPPGLDTREGPEPFAVYVWRSPKQPWPGYGIYLGDGKVVTAAHVVGSHNKGNPSVTIGGRDFEATVAKMGEFEGVDLALLAVDPRQLPAEIGLSKKPLCDAAPVPGQDVVVAIPGAVVHSRILSPNALPLGVPPRFDTLIADVATTGNSGSGVFDARTQCLMGIMSRKISRWSPLPGEGGLRFRLEDVAKYFVPAAQIRAFVGRD